MLTWAASRAYEKLKQWRALTTRYNKLAVIFRGGAILRSIVFGSGVR
ncbi:MAG: hypothetical protein H7323_02310 [Frankiales bacterium]|nr:hypothetical protein [Frankiales bacterium]